MAPPWDICPEIPPGSIGWRMGLGEAVYDEFYKMFSALSPEEREAYAQAHPEAAGWEGLYDMIAESPWL